MSTPTSPSETTELNLEMKVGDNVPVVITVRDISGNATISLIGAHATYKINSVPSAITKDSANVGEIDVDSTNQQFTINFGDTSAVTAGSYDHQCRIKLANGQRHTVFEGQFTFRPGLAAIP